MQEVNTISTMESGHKDLSVSLRATEKPSGRPRSDAVTADLVASYGPSVLDPRRLFVPVGRSAFSRTDGHEGVCLAPSTQVAYRDCWTTFERWCHVVSACPFPAAPHALSLYFSHLADQGWSTSTIRVHFAALQFVYRALERGDVVADEDLRPTLTRILARQTAPNPSKNAATDSIVRDMVAAIEQTGTADLRDRALLLIGSCAGLRASEIVGLDLVDVVYTPGGVVLQIPTSDTGTKNKRRAVPIKTARIAGRRRTLGA